MSKSFKITMTLIALIVGVFAIFVAKAVNDAPPKPDSIVVVEPVAEEPVVEETVIQPYTQPPKTKEMAHKFANKIYAEIYENDIYMFDAYSHGEVETLQKLTYNFNRVVSSFKSYGDDPNWTLAPYYDCESAQFEQRNLLFALERDLRANDADSRKQIRYRQGRFDKAFEKCQSRVEMTPEQAQESYDIEQS
ncbi:hypothetical protein [Psychrobacter fulvigenes]|uniref:hypothetical protein n=1 Tax=Psychrobacter fulvigenes TaxID=533323 RepID=UPI00191885C7|nr:hypothetical protein [Psychrobacter fulvigenes]